MKLGELFTVVTPSWRGTVDGHGNLRFEREARA